MCVCMCVGTQALNDSIAEHEFELTEVTQCGTELRQLAAIGDDVARLDSELDSITSRYRALRRTSKERLSQMTEVPMILQRFYTTHQTVIDCISQLESQLEQRDVQPGPEVELHLQVSLIMA